MEIFLTHLEAHALQHLLDLLELGCVGANLVTLPVWDRGECAATHDCVSSEMFVRCYH